MSNEDLPLNAELASAYLDDELDETARASAGADPDVIVTIDSFAQVRAILGEVGPGVASTKTAAIAAALAEFDAIHRASPAAAVATVTSLQSRRLRVYRVMTGVAAAAIVGVVAIAAIGSTGGDDAKSSSGTELSAAAPSEIPDLKSATDNATAAAGATAASGAGLSTESAAADVPAIDTPEALQQFAADIDSARTSTAAPSPADTASPPPIAAQAPAAGDVFASPACLTSDQVVLGSVFSLGRSATVVRDTSSGVLQTLDDADCKVLVEYPAP
ncbi:MAG: hypothetical protein ABI862_20125 [Ilumatobacteraceae bacterium]